MQTRRLQSREGLVPEATQETHRGARDLRQGGSLERTGLPASAEAAGGRLPVPRLPWRPDRGRDWS